ncbi:phage tail protein [Aquabacter cavernae]|uniref:phage tail protein n=1 Tax=Aquabacter cavernae TaxID=2496029 RepID=UPI000F8CA70B|nr:tail fiber protein [Aquabacter cavernae]
MAYIGQIILYAGNVVPRDWAPCDGRILPIQYYQALYALLGNRFGGDGRTTFALPDLRGRVAVGRAAQSRGDDVIPATVGATGGNDTVALVSDQMPRHNHAFQASTAVQTTPTAPPGAVAAAVPNHAYFYLEPPATGTTLALLRGSAVREVGDNTPHNNLMPCLGLSYLICLSGDFPSPNFEMK